MYKFAFRVAPKDSAKDAQKREYKMIYYHFTADKLRDGRPIPAIGEWLVYDGIPIPCDSGLHASPTPWDAMEYAPGNLLHKVELDGMIVPCNCKPIDKFAAQRRMIVATIDATKLMRDFARRQALSVLHLWNATDVVQRYLKTGDLALRDSASRDAWRVTWSTSGGARWAAWLAARAASGDTPWQSAWTVRVAGGAIAQDAARDDFNSTVEIAFRESTK